MSPGEPGSGCDSRDRGGFGGQGSSAQKLGVIVALRTDGVTDRLMRGGQGVAHYKAEPLRQNPQELRRDDTARGV